MPVFNFVGVHSTLTVTSTATIAYDDPLVVQQVATLVEYHFRVPVERIRFWEVNPALHTYKLQIDLSDGRTWKQSFYYETPYDSEIPRMTFDSTDKWRRFDLDGLDAMRRQFTLLRSRHGVTDWDWNTL